MRSALRRATILFAFAIAGPAVAGEPELATFRRKNRH